ncbi:MAG: NAD(P)-dependent oxidoreductase [Ignavibacteriales bacterium]|nr:NAD(P)-dependent oxidoreductase [Ignavibacteriales bacterium]
MKLLVTGGSGLVGRYVVEDLSQGHTVEVLDLKNPRGSYNLFHRANILSLSSLIKIIKDYDAVVHLAGIPHPLNEPPEKVFQVNTVGTFNVLEACALNNIPKVVFMSSESTLGFSFSITRMWPEYAPIDENHPLRPQDPYGLSKVSSELLCAAYTRTYGIQTICLRPPWVWVPDKKEVETYRQLIQEYPKWSKNLWAYVHVQDVVQAVRLAVEATELSFHDSFYISADDNWTGRESRELLKEFYPETTKVDQGFSGTSSLISNAKAKETLKFSPKFAVKDIIP